MSAASVIGSPTSELIRLARNVTPENRGLLYHKIADLFQANEKSGSAHERSLLIEIMNRLTHQVEMGIRMRLAQKLAGEPRAPHELILLLVNDDVEVATPVILQSKVLSDDDLIEIIEKSTASHQIVVAKRPEISEGVSGKLFETQNDLVLCALAENTTARLSVSTITGLAETSKRLTSLQSPLIGRSDLPEELAERMYSWVSKTLQSKISKNFAIDQELLERKMAESVNEERTNPQDEARSQRILDLINKLHKTGQLKPSYLIKSLRDSQIDMFEIALAKLAEIDQHTAQVITINKDLTALAYAIRAANIDRSTYPTIATGLFGRELFAQATPSEKARIKAALQIDDAKTARQSLLKSVQ